jgi:hypothetical protein
MMLYEMLFSNLSKFLDKLPPQRHLRDDESKVREHISPRCIQHNVKQNFIFFLNKYSKLFDFIITMFKEPENNFLILLNQYKLE